MIPRFYQVEAAEAFLQALELRPDSAPLIAMPTGTGKSLTIAIICKRLLTRYPGMRITISTTSKRLVKQDAKALQRYWPEAPFGIFSAGLGVKNPRMPITLCTVQSAAKVAHLFGTQHLVIVDEAQDVGPKDDTNYQSFFAGLRLKNIKLRVGGLSATCYRMKGGMLADGPTFTEVCYDITGRRAFNVLIDMGYLAPLHAKPTEFKFDVSKVRTTGDGYNQGDVQKVMNVEEKSIKALQEALQILEDRKYIMVFCSGVEHVNSVTAILQGWGETAVHVHSLMGDDECDLNYEAFDSKQARFIVNDAMLVKGVDFPHCDGMILLNPTKSTGRHVQILGRGTRTDHAPGFDISIPEELQHAIELGGKPNGCRVCDFVGNLERLGPINDPKIPGSKKGKTTGEPPTKECPQCGCTNFAGAGHCWSCDFEFQFETKIKQTATTVAPVAKDAVPKIEKTYKWLPVTGMEYSRHYKQGSPISMRVVHKAGSRSFSKFVCLEHSGAAGRLARKWWRDRLPEGFTTPETTEEGMMLATSLPEPRWVLLRTDQKFWEIEGISFAEQEPIEYRGII